MSAHGWGVLGQEGAGSSWVGLPGPGRGPVSLTLRGFNASAATTSVCPAAPPGSPPVALPGRTHQEGVRGHPSAWPRVSEWCAGTWDVQEDDATSRVGGHRVVISVLSLPKAKGRGAGVWSGALGRDCPQKSSARPPPRGVWAHRPAVPAVAPGATVTQTCTALSTAQQGVKNIRLRFCPKR